MQDAGFEVVEACDSDAAIILLDGTRSFEAPFTDVHMPGSMDGVDLAHQVRRRHPGMPVLVVSGYAANLLTRLGALAPSIEFIGKPYDFPNVERALRKLTSAA